MAQEKTPTTHHLTTADTDSESGQEGLCGPEAQERALWALTQMFERGLLTQEEYAAACASIPPPQTD